MQLTISHVGHRGDGVANGPNGTVFVARALAGETVEVSGPGEHPVLQRIVTASAERTEPHCPAFGTCGGCALQHWQNEPYLAWKRELVALALRQEGLDAPIMPTVDAHGEGRRRITLHARRDATGRMQTGFAQARSHALVDIPACPITVPALSGAFAAVRDLASRLPAAVAQADFLVTASDNGLDIALTGPKKLAERERLALIAAADSHDLARLTHAGDLVVMRRRPYLHMGKANVPLSPGVFLQATAQGEASLAALVVEAAKGAKNVADLFCGIGTFAYRLAESAKVTAYDADAAAIGAIGEAMRFTTGLKPIAAEARDLFRRPLKPLEMKGIDTVVIDPPRQGAEAQMRDLARMPKLDRIIAVSCNPTTFARDARILVDAGWTLQRVTPVDQFRHSAHVELVAVLRR